MINIKDSNILKFVKMGLQINSIRGQRQFMEKFTGAAGKKYVFFFSRDVDMPTTTLEPFISTCNLSRKA